MHNIDYERGRPKTRAAYEIKTVTGSFLETTRIGVMNHVVLAQSVIVLTSDVCRLLFDS